MVFGSLVNLFDRASSTNEAIRARVTPDAIDAACNPALDALAPLQGRESEEYLAFLRQQLTTLRSDIYRRATSTVQESTTAATRRKHVGSEGVAEDTDDELSF